MSRLSNTLTRLGRLLGIRPTALEEQEHSLDVDNFMDNLERNDPEVPTIRQNERYNRDNTHYFVEGNSSFVHVSNSNTPIQWSTPTNNNITISANRVNAAGINYSPLSCLRVHAGLGAPDIDVSPMRATHSTELAPKDPHLPSI